MSSWLCTADSVLSLTSYGKVLGDPEGFHQGCGHSLGDTVQRATTMMDDSVGLFSRSTEALATSHQASVKARALDGILGSQLDCKRK